MRTRTTAAVILLLSLAATASAAAGSGQFRADGPVDVGGLADFQLSGPFLTLSDADGGFAFALEAAAVSVERTWSDAVVVHTGVPQVHEDVPTISTWYHLGERQTETLEFAQATGNLLAAEPTPNAGAILVAWSPDGTLDWQDAENAVASVATDAHADPFSISVDADGDSFWVHRIPVPGPHFDVPASGEFVLEGDFQLYLFNVDYVLSDSEGDHLFSTGFPKETTTEGRVEKNVLTVTDGVLRVAAPQARLRAPAFSATLDGTLGLQDATGYFDSGNARYEAARLPAVLEGAFTLHAEAVASGGDDPVAFLTLDGDLRKASLAPRDAPRGVLPTPEAAGKAAAWAGGTLALVAGSVVLARRGRERWIAGHVEDPAQCVEHALAASAAGEHKQALRWYRRARALAPKDAILALDEGLAAEAATGSPSAARASYEEALRLDPQLPEAHLRYARALAHDGMQPAALSHLGRALALDPGLAGLAAEDPHFAPWRDHPRFADLLRHYRPT